MPFKGNSDHGTKEVSFSLLSRCLKVTLGAAAVYQEQLQRLAGLSPQGSAQLAADLEYFANVLTTLGVAVPPALAAWQVGSGSLQNIS